jgi:hypothetical protein
MLEDYKKHGEQSFIFGIMKTTTNGIKDERIEVKAHYPFYNTNLKIKS